MDALDDDDDDDFLRALASVDEVAPPPADALRPRAGDRLGHFEIVSPLGRGGMGVVYLARDVRLGRRVALKLLPPSFAGDALRRERLLREARAAAALSHPNLVAIHEVGEHESAVYLVLEYVDGETLRARLAKGELAIDDAVRLGRGILAGLAHAHDAGLLHRDLKPENVLVGCDGRARILDFGLAKLSHEPAVEGGSRLTRDGSVLGTPGYMAPEQARGLDADERSDVFAFGATFFEMLTGERAFAGTSSADIVSAVLRDEPPRVTVVRPDVPPALADVVARCLRKSAGERYASVHDALGALEAASRTPAVSAPPPRRSRGLLAFAAAAVVVAGLAGVALNRHPVTVATALPAAANDAGASGLALTAVPLPQSSSPAAVAAYAQGLQAYRDADWDEAMARFDEAVAADPSLAAAHLRRAILMDGDDGYQSDVRSMFARAMNARANLSPRDQAIADAVEPAIDSVPADTALTKTRLRALIAANPGDAELRHLLVIFGAWGTAEGIRVEEEAVALDPQFADAWQLLAGQRARTGDIAGAISALDRCVAVVPWSKDCRFERARILSASGQCEPAEEELRRSSLPTSRFQGGHDLRASTLFALGREDETVLEVFQQKWAVVPAARRDAVTAYDTALLAAARGRFTQALGAIEKATAATERDTNLVVHSRLTLLHVGVLRELGRPAEAAAVAARYLQRRDVWVGRSFRSDVSVPMLRVLQQAGKISKDELVRRRDAWIARSLGKDGAKGSGLWTGAFASGVETREEALAALETLPDYPDGTDTFCGADARASGLEGGIALALAGQTDRAIPVLENAVHRCDWLHDPIRVTRGFLRLGEAYEAEHDVGRACASYRTVADRWAKAPASVTRDAANAGLARLRCGAVQGDPTPRPRPSVAAPAPPTTPSPPTTLVPPMPPMPPMPPEMAAEVAAAYASAAAEVEKAAAACTLAPHAAAKGIPQIAIPKVEVRVQRIHRDESDQDDEASTDD